MSYDSVEMTYEFISKPYMYMRQVLGARRAPNMHICAHAIVVNAPKIIKTSGMASGVPGIPALISNITFLGPDQIKRHLWDGYFSVVLMSYYAVEMTYEFNSKPYK